jgi:hypothetical protein
MTAGSLGVAVDVHLTICHFHRSRFGMTTVAAV